MALMDVKKMEREHARVTEAKEYCAKRRQQDFNRRQAGEEPSRKGKPTASQMMKVLNPGKGARGGKDQSERRREEPVELEAEVVKGGKELFLDFASKPVGPQRQESMRGKLAASKVTDKWFKSRLQSVATWLGASLDIQFGLSYAGMYRQTLQEGPTAPTMRAGPATQQTPQGGLPPGVL